MNVLYLIIFKKKFFCIFFQIKLKITTQIFILVEVENVEQSKWGDISICRTDDFFSFRAMFFFFFFS